MSEVRAGLSNQNTSPRPDEIRAAIESYARAVSAQDTAAIVAHFTQDAVQEDPVGGPVHRGHQAIAALFQSGYDTVARGKGIEFRTDGHIRVAGRFAVANMITDWMGSKRTLRIYSSDVFTFNEDCLITSLKAYWGDTDTEYLT